MRGGHGRPAPLLTAERRKEPERKCERMFVRVTRTAIAPLWLVVFGLVALVWSPLTVAMGALLLLVGLAAPAAVLFWKGR